MPFTRQAASDYEAIATEVEAANAEEAAEIEEAFEALSVALPGVQPPSTVAPLEDVEAAAELIGHDLEEVVGALPVSESDPAAEQAAIEGLLDQISELVASGNRDEAAELAAEAYLEHYEVIEAGGHRRSTGSQRRAGATARRRSASADQLRRNC